MNRASLVRFAVVLLLAGAAWAEAPLQMIALRHRTAEQVLPVLQPLVEPGGTLSGQGTQLFVRTSPANLAELRRALETIDRPAKRLLISVRYDAERDAASRAIDGSGRIGSRDSRVDIRAEDARSRGDERVEQRLQVLEGSRATILTGASRPVRQREYIQTPAGVIPQEITVMQETASGFEVIPRLAGDRVQVEIVQQREQPASYQRAASTVSGRLGEWFELGAVAMGGARDERGLASASRTSGGETRRVWVRVDELP
ncbi:MAG: secretin N-terminal domain-containing protein [Burkholderiales bacterium]